jgi:hypothetical protein
MKSKLVMLAMLICVAAVSASAVAQTKQTKKPAPVKRQQVLVKRINQGALRVYKTFVRQSERTITVDCELNELLEDLLLAADGLTDSRYIRHNLVVVMQIASDIEQVLLALDVSSDMIMAWSRLHADLDQLAKMNGMKWSEAVITDQLIATLISDIDNISTKVNAELSPLQPISATTYADLPVLLSSFRRSAQDLNTDSGEKLHDRIKAVRSYARAINASLNNCVISSTLQHKWKRVTSRLEELVRLYNLDSLELDQRPPEKVADQS